MDLVPQFSINDCDVLARIAGALVHGFADVDPIVEQPVEMALIEGGTLASGDPCLSKGSHDGSGRSDLSKLREDQTYGCRVSGVHHQFAVFHLITQRRIATHPHALHATGANLVANALGGHLALELGKAEQDVQGQPPHRRGGAE